MFSRHQPSSALTSHYLSKRWGLDGRDAMDQTCHFSHIHSLICEEFDGLDVTLLKRSQLKSPDYETSVDLWGDFDIFKRAFSGLFVCSFHAVFC